MNDKGSSKSKSYTIEDLENLIDNIPYGVWIKGEDKKFKYANKSFSEKFGRSKENIIGKTDNEFMEKGTCERFLSKDKEVIDLKTGILTDEKISINGEEKWFEIYMSLLSKEPNEPKLIGGIEREITLDKKLSYGIDKSSKEKVLYNKSNYEIINSTNLERLTKIIRLFSQKVDADGVSVFLYNDESDMLNLYLTTGKAKIKKENHIIHIDSNIKKTLLNSNRYENIQKIKKCKEYQDEHENNLYIRTYTIKHNNELIGTLNLHYYKNNISICKQDDLIKSTCYKLGIIINNVVLLKKLKKEFCKRAESEKQLEMFLETATDLCAISRNNEYYRRSIDKWTEVLGWNEEELKNIHYRDLIYHNDLKELDNIHKFADKWQNATGFINKCLCKNGEYKLIEWNWNYVKEKDSYIITGKDISKTKKLEEYKKTLEDTFDLESLKNEFFANMSYEFKTPLNIIVNTIKLICKQIKMDDDMENKDSIIKYIEGAKQNSYRLSKLVNNLIDITKIDSGNYKLDPKNYNIVREIEAIILAVKNYIGQNGRNIKFSTKEQEIILYCDIEKVEKVVFNLLSNALKNTDKKGNIEVILEQDLENQKVSIHVKNDGASIAKENAETIFGRFNQPDNFLTRRCEGSGIGLSLTKLLIEMHGGNIWVNTRVKKGAEFIFTIPIIEDIPKKIRHINLKELEPKIEKCNVEFSDVYTI